MNEVSLFQLVILNFSVKLFELNDLENETN